MKLERLTLDNFSSHRATTIDFSEPLTLVVGALNAGKSSLTQAVEFALTGETERYRKKNCAFTDLIHDADRNEQSRFTVTLKTAEGTIKRGRAMTGPTFCSWDGQVENAEGIAYGVWKTRKEVLSSLLQTADFFDLDANTQKELVLQLIGVNVSTQAIRSAFQGDAAAFKLLRLQDYDSIPALDAAYKESYDLRTAVNRELKGLQPPPLPEGDEPPIDKIRERIAVLERERSAATSELGGLRVKAQRSGGEKQRLEQQLSQLEDWLEKNAKPDESTLKALELEIVKAKDAQVEAENELKIVNAELVTLKAEQLLHEKNFMTLRSFNGRCVVGDHECPASKDVMEGARDAEGKAAVELKKEIQAKGAAAQVLDLKSRDRGAIAAIESRIADYRTAVREWEARDTQADRLDEQIKALPEEVDHSQEIKGLEGKIAEFDQRLGKGRQTLENAQTWTFRKKEVDRVAGRRKELEQQSTNLEALVEFFGPKGVRVKLIEEKVAGFQSIVNEGVKAFGFEFSFQAEPWKILAKGRPVDRLSRSERFRLGVALQVGIARTTGSNFLIIDNAEILTPDARSQMLGLLLKSGVQAIVVMTTMKTEAEFKAAPPKIPGGQVLWVGNEGGVSKVEVL